ncbi:glycoside hydrolase family 3 C-terminal domain-containing protein (plasmid) [Streptomyces sp. NBC_01558]|uniref:glycoside hydrolase family 3 protein n=1 Tax=Streptomyces sp. NBC_01558 TaxID=2975878 RepID=UPI002DDB2E47|nr:glycoside hydrolase family 3 C-terminal domain-containing protein [Streptomyces sp. NBC_01558]WSD82828.1 glycoside hydrolase family 3 C-terminal domain-containing protein [Streptomyces sp. NBC_01558]
MTDPDDLDLLARLTAGADMQTTHRDPEHHVRALRLVDGPMGVTGGLLDERDVSLLAPSGTALAATFNRATVEAVGELLGEQAAARGVDVLLGPNLNLSRSPAGGRNFEHFGEDPYLAGVLGAAWITGVQSKGVGACAKHLVCNDTETGRHGYDVQIDEQTLHEVYLAPFAAAARAGVWAMMAAYNKVNGQHCAEHPGLLTRVLREQWDWDGVVMSDWFGTHSTTASLTAGLDLEMPGPARHLGPAAAAAVRAGDVPASTVQRAIEHLALLSHRTAGRTAPTRPPAETRRLLHEAAADSFVLLKNDHTILPLAGDTSVAVIGPNADEPAYQGGTFARIALGPEVRTPLTALREALGPRVTAHEPGAPSESRVPSLLPLGPRATDSPGDPGFTVTFHRVDTDGAVSEPLATDTRATGILVWFTELPGIGALADLPPGSSGLVRVSCLLTPETDGTYDFHFAGTGDLRLLIDGQETGRGGSRALPADVMGALLHGDVTRIPVSLTAGRQVRIDFEMSFTGGGRAQGMQFGARAAVPADLAERAVRAARVADTAIVFAGVSQDSSLESQDRDSLALPAAQTDLIEQVCAANPSTVVVVNAPFAVDMPWAERAAAVLLTWFPGQEYGPALADVLTGALEPGGRLPITLARADTDHAVTATGPSDDGRLTYTEGVLTGYRHFDAQRITPRFCFGHGLGYANLRWRAAHLHTDPTGRYLALAGVTLSSGTGRGGKEVVQVYAVPLTPTGATEPGRPEQHLVGFTTVHVPPAPAQPRIDIPLHVRDFSVWDPRTGSWRPRAGRWEIRLARSSRDVFHRFRVYVDEDGKLRTGPNS